MAAHNEESRRIDPGRDQAQSKKSVNSAASSKSKTDVDDDWGFEPKKGGMAIEAKMGMCIVVILISAFGFLVYRKFDARQRSLLQANLQSAEQVLPGSTTGTDGDPYAEFRSTDPILTNKTVSDPPSKFDEVSANDMTNPEPEMTPGFGSTFALQDAPEQLPPQIMSLGSANDDDFAGASFDENPFAGLDEPEFNPGTSDFEGPDHTATLALSSETTGAALAGQISSPMDEYLAPRESQESAPGGLGSETEASQADSPFAAFGNPEQSAIEASSDSESSDDSFADIMVADGSPFGVLQESQSDRGQPADTQSPNSSAEPSPFQGFPAGFESETNPAAGTSTAMIDSSEKTTRAAFGTDETSPGNSPFGDQLTTEVAARSVEAKEDEWTLVPRRSQQTSPSISEFDSFGAELAKTEDEAGGKTELATSDFPFTERDVSSGSRSATATDAPAAVPGFESFGEDDFSGSVVADAVPIQISQPSVDANAATEQSASASRGFDKTFASSESDAADLSPTGDLIGAMSQGIPTTRRPAIDPSAVLEPFDGVERAQLISQTDRELEANPPPIDSTESGIADSFDSFSNSTTEQFDPSLRAAEGLRLPSFRNEQQTAIVNTKLGKIQQVSATRDPDGIYTVRDDDTYWTISRHAYGTARFFSSLALYNKNRIKDPRRLRKGMKVVIPDPQVLIERYPELLQDYIPKESKPTGYFLKKDGMPAYRIGERETLSEISQKHLGRASRWIQIYRMNQDVLQNPNRLKPGTVIALPDDATNVHLVP